MVGRAFVLHGGAAVVLVADVTLWSGPWAVCAACVCGFRRGGLGVRVDASASNVGGTVAFRQWPTVCDHATVHIEQHPAAF